MAGFFKRLGYLRYPFTRVFWRWVLQSVDAIVGDHLVELRRLHRGARVAIHPSVSFRHAGRIHIGDDTRLQQGVVLWASPRSEIRIGDHTGLGPGTMVFSSNHDVKARGIPYWEQPWIEREVTIGRNVWVGSGCILLPGVRIGDDSVVAAGSVVTRDVPAGSVAAGVPARVIAHLDPAPSGGGGSGRTSGSAAPDREDRER